MKRSAIDYPANLPNYRANCHNGEDSGPALCEEDDHLSESIFRQFVARAPAMSNISTSQSLYSSRAFPPQRVDSLFNESYCIVIDHTTMWGWGRKTASIVLNFVLQVLVETLSKA